MTDDTPHYLSHPKFGVGRLIGADAQYAEVMFVEAGRKRFHRDYAFNLLGDAPSETDAAALAKLCKGLTYLRPGEVALAKEAAEKKRTARKRTTKKAAKKASKKATKKASKKASKKAAGRSASADGSEE
jgi:hypothetical protein